jgi:hypothetical protein
VWANRIPINRLRSKLGHSRQYDFFDWVQTR